MTGHLQKSTTGPMDAWLAKDSAEHAATQAAESLVSKPKVSKLNKSIALDQTGYGAIQRVHLGRTAVSPSWGCM